jgi:hypothetical protein
MEEYYTNIRQHLQLVHAKEELTEDQYRTALLPLLQERVASIQSLRAKVLALKGSLAEERRIGEELH